jgi:hypothetical protein
MFTIDQLQQDKDLKRFVPWIIKSDFKKLGCFVGVDGISTLYERISKATLTKVKHLPKSNIGIYVTHDIGVGYCDCYSLFRFRELISLNKIPKEIPVYLDYCYGNVQSYVKSTDLNIDSLLTDEVYIFIKEDTKEIWDIRIGKPTAPNRLYYQNELNNITGTIDKIATIPGINMIRIKEILNVDFI